MRRVLAIVSAAAVLCSGAAWAVASTSSASPASRGSTALATEIIRSTQFYGTGPSAVYSFDTGSIGGVSALRMTLPAGGTYEAVVSISMDYRTSERDGFVVGLWARRDSEFGDRVSVTPRDRAIRASAAQTSTTAVFRISDLQGDVDYWFSPTVNLDHRVGDRASIRSSHVLLVVEATPST
jgi:hypothetical protein